MGQRLRRDPLTGILLVLAVILLVVGLQLPALTIKKFLVFDSTKSIFGTVRALFEQGHVALGIVVTAFSIIFPIVKLSLSFMIWLAADPGSPAVRRLLYWTVKLGKWSMLDVFMAAIIVASVTLGMIASVTTEAGLYVFAAAILTSMIAAHRLESRMLAAIEEPWTTRRGA